MIATQTDRQSTQPPPRAVAWLAASLALAGCAGVPQRSSGDIAATSACRQRADEIYAKQNRGEVYATDTFATSGRDSPFSNTNLPGVTTRGLSGEYQRDNMVSDCLAGTGPARGSSGSAGPSGPSTSLGPATSAEPPGPQP